jgi:protein subunit release factor B
MPRELLFSVTKDDLTIQTFCSGGPGGQHQNKVETGVRIIHKESGAVGESRSERSQHTNKKLAFERLVKSPKFKVWFTRKTNEVLTGKTIEQRVNEMMQLKNIKTEVKNEKGQWQEAAFGEISLEEV